MKFTKGNPLRMKWRLWLPPNPPQSVACDLIEPLLSLYSDGMASAREARLVESHLGTCPDCQRALEWMRVTQLVISKRPVALPPADLRARIAQSIAQAEQNTPTFRTTPRSFVLRPAFLTTAVAATIAAFGLYLGLSLPPARPPVVGRPVSGAQGPQPAPHSVASVPASRSVGAHPAKSSEVAHVPPREATPARLPKDHPLLMARLAKASELESHDIAMAEKNLAVKPLHPLNANPLSRNVRLASRPKPPSITVLPSPRKDVVVATALPKTADNRISHDVVVDTSPELAAPSPQTAEIIHSDAARVAVAIPTVVHPVHEDVLSNVRARLAAFRSESSDRKVYRDNSVRVQTAAYSDGEKAVPLPIVWTPTSLSNGK